uniref:Uncharacterized protein n=1 Tax=viral metagenome TaxID=1070528 RepID=A0A6C0CA86_9ZZZZ
MNAYKGYCGFVKKYIIKEGNYNILLKMSKRAVVNKKKVVVESSSSESESQSYEECSGSHGDSHDNAESDDLSIIISKKVVKSECIGMPRAYAKYLESLQDDNDILDQILKEQKKMMRKQDRSRKKSDDTYKVLQQQTTDINNQLYQIKHQFKKTSEIFDQINKTVDEINKTTDKIIEKNDNLKGETIKLTKNIHKLKIGS